MIDRGFWRGRRVLLTGHTGFMGAWLALWLHELGARVTGFATAPPTDPSLFELARVGELLDDRRGDVRDAAAVSAAVASARPEVVLHLAAQALVRQGVRDPVATYEVNVMGTAHVLDAVRAAAPQAAVVVVTSDKCYAHDGSRRPFREDDPLGGSDPYSSSKAAQELVAGAMRETFGLRLATARAGNAIGGGDWAADRLVPDLFAAALAGRPLLVRSPGAVRPWQHVLDPLDGYLRLVERLSESGDCATAWNFGPPAEDERTVAWLVERLRAAWPGPLEVTVASDGPPAAEAPWLGLDSSQARERLGWRGQRTLAEGLADTAAWYAALRRGEDMRAVTVGQIPGLA